MYLYYPNFPPLFFSLFSCPSILFLLSLPQVQDMETTRHFHLKEAEEMEAVKRENEELKDVLSAVQLDLEAKTEVGRGRVRGVGPGGSRKREGKGS